MDSPVLADLIARAKDGDEAAVHELLQRFETEVRLVVRSRLPRSLRSQFDSMDFVQAVWTSVLAKDGENLERFENSRHLFGFLAGVARNKVFEEHRRRTRTRKYDLKREESLYVRRGGREIPRDLPTSDPTPSADVQAKDQLSLMLRGRDPIERRVVDMRRRGLTYDSIAACLHMHESAVRRIVNGMRERLEARERR